MGLKKKVVEVVGQAKDGVVSKVPEVAGVLKSGVESKVQEINVEDALAQAMRLPVAKVGRELFLRKELKLHHPADKVNLAISNNPAFAGITREEIDKLAKNVINYETNKVSAISFATGLPGGIAMAATVPADILQYFTFILRVMQKLAYLYGFEEFELDKDHIDDGTLNEIMVFLGVMFGVQEANAAVKVVAGVAARNIAKKLAYKPLTKGFVYPIVKSIAKAVGAKMTKQIFANGVSKVVPVIGGVVTGGLTYATFKPCANNLKESLRKLPLSDPEFYKSGAYKNTEPIDVTDLEEVVEEDSEIGYYVDTTTA